MTDRTGTIRRAQFAQVDISLLEQCIDEQRKGSLFVYLWLWHYAGRADTAFPSVARLAVECRMNQRDVRDALQWLTANGWIRAQVRPGHTTVYHVRTERPEGCKRDTPTPKRGAPKRAVPQKDPSPKRGSTPLPQTVQGTPPPNGTPNKRELTKENEQEVVRTPLPPQTEAAPQAATPTKRQPSAKARQQAFTPTADDIPADLLPVQHDLLDFWAEKRGARSQRAWNGLCAELQKIHRDPNGGADTLRAQLNAAIQAGWQSVTYANWQRYAAPAQHLLPLGSRQGGRYTSRAEREQSACDDVVAFLSIADPDFAPPSHRTTAPPLRHA
jgi:hypothetical protein